MENQTHDRLIRERECKEITGLSRQTRWRMEKEGKFPSRIQLSERAIAWRLSEVLQWVNNAISVRA
ncbi:transcriptional regulator [Vibrio albus]|uniref:Transcriptional regulator n=1 Tax=Vibrio albus TaxID=2200953 RepID=A0A2U3B8N0_9VIBR|nr:AlpA family transcriptional regulator [Vibrio albus]PWI33074.1 transcriptional regulator [Vibrio albus]